MFRGYHSSGTYAICNVEIEVDRLERNGGNVFGVPRPNRGDPARFIVDKC